MCLVLRELKKANFSSGDPALRTPVSSGSGIQEHLPADLAPLRQPGIPPANSPFSYHPGPWRPRAPRLALRGWEQYFLLDSVSLGLHSQWKLHRCLFSRAERYSLCAVSVGPHRVLLSRGTFSPQSLSMLLVSGTFFFPTSEINEISISHLTQSDYASFFFFSLLTSPPPNK